MSRVEHFRFSHDVDRCRQHLAQGSKSFFAASRLLPARYADPATALYAFCREVDDIIDAAPAGSAQIGELTERLDSIYAGTPEERHSDRALAVVVHRHGIPRRLLDALIEGMLWDTEGRQYASLAELRDYAARVAGSVGSMMALIMGARDENAQSRACDLGVAMQLTNIARDVGEDARNGRIYLPLDLMEQAGINPETFLREPRFSPATASITEHLLRAADVYYQRGLSGIRMLPPACRPSMTAAGLLYREIGHQLRREGLNNIDNRAIVSGKRKIMVVARAAMLSLTPASAVDEAALPECQFLVSEATQSQDALEKAAPLWNLAGHVDWMCQLHERLETRQRPLPRARKDGG